MIKLDKQKRKHILRKRKVLSFVFLIGWLIYAFPVNAQKINQEVEHFKITEGSLALALQNLQKVANVNILYETKDLNEAKVKTREFNKQKVGEILKELIKNTELLFEEKQGVIILKAVTKEVKGQRSSKTQSFEVKGKVTDQITSTGVPGVSVVIKNTSLGTVTDVDGAYKLIIPDDKDTLVFSSIGYVTETIAINNRNVIDVALYQDITTLQDVVVIGYGKAKKEELTSSVASIANKDFNKGVLGSPDQLLQGKVAGLTISRNGDPNGTPSIILRGASTLREGAAQEPFYVIDGVPGASIKLVAPDDIVSIDVLKDASATAIYGSRAANGVIIITTRKAKPSYGFSYNGYVGVEKVSNTIDVLSGDELRAYLKKNGKSLFERDNSYTVNGTDTTFSNIDWQKEVMRTGVSQNHTLSYGGGTEKANFNASVNYFKNEGVMKGSASERLIGKISLEQKVIKDRLTLSFQLTNSLLKQNLIPDAVFRQMVSYIPSVSIRNEDGTFRENTIDHTSNYFNPLAIVELNKEERKTNTLLGYANARLKIYDRLHYNLSLSMQNVQVQGGVYQDSKAILPINYLSTTYSGSQAGGLAKRYTSADNRQVLESFFEFDPIKTTMHDLKILAGYSWQYDESNDGFQATNNGFVSDATGYDNLGLGTSTLQSDYGNYSMVPLRLISFYSRVMYFLADKYLLQASIRRDGSSAFSEDNRWGNFPAASAAWIISREEFMKSQNIVQSLKLRAGYGVTGNSLGFDPLLSVYRYSNAGTFYNNGKYTQALGSMSNVNSDLRWEKTGMFNAGIDFSILQNRLSGTVEYYEKKTTDLIYNYPVSTTLFVQPEVTANVGSITNKGVELTLNATAIQTSTFKWEITGVLSHNKNEVTKLSNFRYQLDSIATASGSGAGVSGVYTQIIKEGYPIGTFNLYQYAGRNEAGVSTYFAQDGSITQAPKFPADAKLMGNAQPILTYGFGSTVSWKSWSLNFYMRGVYGNDILNSTRAILSSVSQANVRNIPKSAENEPMTDVNNNFYSDRYLEKGSFLRLDNVTLGYTLPFNTDFMKSARVYVTGQNLLVITKYSGIDPEVNLGGLTPGFDNNNFYPRTRGFLAGISLDF